VGVSDVELVHIPILQGMSEAADSKLLPNGLFASIKNARFLKDGRLGLRAGYALADAGALPDAFDATARIVPSDGKDALVYSNKRLYSMRSGSSAAGWLTKTRDKLIGPDAPTRRTLFREDVIDGPTACAAYGTGLPDAILAFVFVRTTGASTKELILSIVGYESNREERREVVASSATAEQAHVLVVSQYICVIWKDGANLNLRTWDATTSAWLGATVNVRTTLTNPSYIAVSTFSGTHFLVASYVSPNLRISRVDATTGAEATTLDYNIGAALTPRPAVSGVSGEGIWLACCTSSGGNWQALVSACNTSLTSTLSTTILEATATPTVVYGHPTISRIDASNRRVFWPKYNSTTAGGQYEMIRSQAVSTTAVTGSISSTYGLSLAGHAFTEGGRNFLVAVNGEVLLDKTYFLLDVSEDMMTAPTSVIAIRAEWARSVAARYVSSAASYNLSTLCSPAAGQWIHGTLVIARGDVDATATFALYGLDYTALDFNGRATFLCRQAHGHIWASGGLARTYDGGAAFEAGPLEIPQINGVQITAGAVLAVGTYKYIALHEIVTQRGNILQSGTSAPFVVVLGAAASQMTVSIKRYNLSQRQPATNYASSAYAIRTLVYRTEVNGSTYYLLSQSGSEYSQAPAQGPTLFVDPVDDLTLITKQRLPTQVGSLLPNATPPPFKHMAVGDGRLVLGGLENPRMVRWSKLFVQDEGPHFAQDATFERPVDEDVVGVAFMDGRWFAFSATAVYETGGDGPDDTGVGTFAPWRKLPGDVGCSNRRSIIETSAGVFFQAAPGQLWIIPRGGSAPLWVGQPVRGQLATNPVIRSAVVLTEEQLVQFACVTDETDAPSGGIVINYDLRAGAWLVDAPTLTVVSVGYLGAKPARLVRSGGTEKTPRVLSAGTYIDAGNVIPTVNVSYIIDTGAIRPFGPIGFGRIITLQILGEFLATEPGGMTVSVSYDNGATFLFTTSFAFTGCTVGEQFVREFCFSRQKAEQIVLRITCASAGTAGLVLNAFTLSVAPRAGGPRLAAASRK